MKAIETTVPTIEYLRIRSMMRHGPRKISVECVVTNWKQSSRKRRVMIEAAEAEALAEQIRQSEVRGNRW